MLRWLRKQAGSIGIAAAVLALLGYEAHITAPHSVSLSPILNAASHSGCAKALQVHSVLLLGAEQMAPYQRAELAGALARFDADRCAVGQVRLDVPPAGDNSALFVDRADQRGHVHSVHARLVAELAAIEAMAQPTPIWDRVPDMIRRHRLAKQGAVGYLVCDYPMAVTPTLAIHTAARLTRLSGAGPLQTFSGLDVIEGRVRNCLSAQEELALSRDHALTALARITPAQGFAHPDNQF